MAAISKFEVDSGTVNLIDRKDRMNKSCQTSK